MGDIEHEGDLLEFRATKGRAIEVTPANYDHPEGEECFVITIAQSDYIGPVAFPIEDAKPMVTKIFVALATYDGSFANKLLHDRFRR